MRKRHRFKAHILSIKQIIVITTTFLASIFVPIFLAMHIPPDILPSDFPLKSISQTVLAFQPASTSSFRFSAYDVLEGSILSIRASEAMQKKYATRYGGIFKTKKENKQEPQLLGNVLETDVSAKGITFINTPGVSVNPEALLSAPLGFYPQDGAPRVLIIHTHTSEAYAESPDARSDNNDYNVVAVGKAIKKALEDAGIGVIHDTTQNDNPSYNQSYKKALSVIEKNLSAYPTLEIVLDIHRDYIKRDDGTLVKPTITFDSGKKAAQIMFVMGTDSMGLFHPNWRHNLSFAVKIQDSLQKTHPGLCRSINIRTERFNQHTTKGSMIIEVGSGVNTIDEAIYSGKLTGEAIAGVLLSQ